MKVEIKINQKKELTGFSQAELGKSKAEIDKHDSTSMGRYNEYSEWRQKYNKAEMEVDRMR